MATATESTANFFETTFSTLRKSAESAVHLQQQLFTEWTKYWPGMTQSTVAWNASVRKSHDDWAAAITEAMKQHRELLDQQYRAGVAAARRGVPGRVGEGPGGVPHSLRIALPASAEPGEGIVGGSDAPVSGCHEKVDGLMPNEALIVAGVRTPNGSLGGVLSSVPAPDLGAACIKAALAKAGVSADEVTEVIMGNVVSGGIGQNPARQAAIKAGVPPSVGATTVNKVCGSGLKAVMLADQAMRLGEAHVVVAGGMESMSMAPYLLTQARQGYRMGHGQLIDSMIQDGLWDVYGQRHMGHYWTWSTGRSRASTF